MQSRNLFLTAHQDPAWLEQSNFSVPPLPFYRVGPPMTAESRPTTAACSTETQEAPGEKSAVTTGEAGAASISLAVPSQPTAFTSFVPGTGTIPLDDPAIIRACAVDQVRTDDLKLKKKARKVAVLN